MDKKEEKKERNTAYTAEKEEGPGNTPKYPVIMKVIKVGEVKNEKEKL